MIKNFEIRATLRPFFRLMPQLQISYLGIFGTGNIRENPDFHLNSCFVSYQALHLTFTAQYEKGTGNSFGTMIDTAFVSNKHEGYSFYGYFNIPETKISFFARFDHFYLFMPVDNTTERFITGVSWFFYKKNKLVLSYQNKMQNTGNNFKRYDLALDISF